MQDLKVVPTDVLVKELEQRAGITTYGCGRYGDYASVSELVVRKKYDRRHSAIALPTNCKTLIVELLSRG